MKCKLIRTDLDVSPQAFDLYGKEFVIANSSETGQKLKLRGKVRDLRRWNWGTVLDSEYAAKQCRQGIAIPADDECREACGMSDAELIEKQRKYEKLSTDGSYEEDLRRKNAPKVVDEE